MITAAPVKQEAEKLASSGFILASCDVFEATVKATLQGEAMGWKTVVED